MSQNFPALVELTILLSIWFVAVGMTAPLLARQKKGDNGFKPTGLISLLVFVLRPTLVLVLTLAFRFVIERYTTVILWPENHVLHLAAWQIFWAGIVGLLLVEGVAHLFFHHRRKEFPIPGLLLNILRLLLVLGLAFGILKVQLGVDIAPLLASTALITAVVGFALQGVLGNLLAGMSIHISRSVLPGQWVDLGDVEGKVIQTNWRETRVRTMAGHLMVIPNSRIAESTVHNMVEPTPIRRHKINVGASYSDSPDEVIAALIEAAKEIPDVMSAPVPDAYITEYQDYGVNYQLRYWSRDYHRRLQIDGEVNRMIWYKFKRRGIEIPFPMSDKLLNDFMAVVYNQRKLDPTDTQLEQVVQEMLHSDLVNSLVVDEQGQPVLTAEDLLAIAPLVKRHLFTAGESLFKQGDEGHSCYILVSGKLAGNVVNDGGETVAKFELEPGTVVGEMSLMLGVPRTAGIVVTESAALLKLGPEAFKELLNVHEGIAEVFAGLAADRAANNKAALEKWVAENPDAEVTEISKAGFLKRFASLMGRR